MDIRLRRVKSATVLDLYGALIIGDPERDLRDHVNKAIAAGARHIAVNLTAVRLLRQQRPDARPCTALTQ